MQVGDVVVLKSGGPLMTIEGQNSGGAFQCVWFEDKTARHGSFKEAVLKKSG